MKYKGILSEEFIQKAWDTYIRYRSDKERLQTRVAENVRAYTAAYTLAYDKENNETIPKTAYILTAVENKYADYLDNFPAPNFLAREESDENAARILSKIMPVQLEMSGFSDAYKKDIRQKLICGTGIYGVFYDAKADNIIINSLDFLSVFVDMNIKDIQKSKFLYIANIVDNDILKQRYPEYSELFAGDVSTIGYEKNKTVYDASEVIDCYYKKDGKVHLIKFCQEEVIAASEDIKEYKDGMYDSGLYPVVFDNMYPEADNPFGFGTVDITKNPQMYVDKLDSAILKNAFLTSKNKYLINRNAGINMDDLSDTRKEIVEGSNISEEAFRVIEFGQLSNGVINYRNQKITELKEVSSTRDVSTGGAAGGVTAASAITALQEAGDKQSRAVISDSYDAYKKIIKMVISLMRQHYTKERIYRITNEDGTTAYTRFSREQLIKAVPQRDALGFAIDTKYKNIDYDIEIVPQKQNAFRRETNNQTILALWNNGFFLPQNLDISLMVLPFFQFEGKDSLIQAISEKNEELKQSQAMAQNMAQEGAAGV